MSHQTGARIATVAVIAAAALFVLWREGKLSVPNLPGSLERAEAQPHDAVYRMLDAVRDGDLDAYIDAHSGAMAESLRRAVAEMGQTKFMEALQRQNATLKGIAINEPERLSPAHAKARVEYVFGDRNEAQTVFLENAGGKWRISRVDGTQQLKTIIPYGTRVNDVR
jgi:hypothetical protein